MPQSVPRLTAGLHIVFALNFVLLHDAHAQSTIELPPSIDLGAPTPPTAEPQQRQGCVTGAEPSCIKGDSAVGFSLEDVVNLGIIDREEAATVVSTNAPDSAETMVQTLPSIDLEVLFDYDSDTLRTDQLPQLIGLAQQLSDVDLSNGYLVVMGHTDAVGSAAYNEGLSLRRARSVAEFLRQNAGVPSHRIRSSGQGFRYLRYPDQPNHGGNRRVQIILAGQGG